MHIELSKGLITKRVGTQFINFPGVHDAYLGAARCLVSMYRGNYICNENARPIANQQEHAYSENPTVADLAAKLTINLDYTQKIQARVCVCVQLQLH